MRRLWHGETILGHDGPAGRYPFLRLDPGFDVDGEVRDLAAAVLALGLDPALLGGQAAEVLDSRQGAQVLNRVEGVDPPGAVRRPVLVIGIRHDVSSGHVR
jgi:hypothetical protein